MSIYENVARAAEAVRARLGGRHPRVGLVLGSGLGGFADRLEDAVRIPFGDVPGFPVSTVPGHSGCLVAGRIGALEVIAMQGRVHAYEGHDLERVVLPVRTLVALGARTLVVTNAAGGINRTYAPGDLVLIRDHINFVGNPLRGDNDERIGLRFPDMSAAYDPELREIARRAADELGVRLLDGVYAIMPGPSYETPAEIRMLAALGADLVGMSTVPEVIAAHHMGARVIGISCVTNLAAGISPVRLSHEEVTETAARVRATFAALLERLLARLPEAA